MPVSCSTYVLSVSMRSTRGFGFFERESLLVGDGTGGASLLVDGFKVAEELRNVDPDAYTLLSTVNVHSHASGNEGISIQPYRGFPVFEHDPTTGHLLRVRWNSSDRSILLCQELVAVAVAVYMYHLDLRRNG